MVTTAGVERPRSVRLPEWRPYDVGEKRRK
jgi:hypothetical protein